MTKGRLGRLSDHAGRNIVNAEQASKQLMREPTLSQLGGRPTLQEAWAQVRRNGGSAGVDEESFADIEERGVERWLGELARELKDGTYAPQAVRQVLIPKKQPGKFRPLGKPPASATG